MRSVKKFPFIFAILSIGIAIVCIWIMRLENQSSQSTPIPSRQVIQNSLSVHEVWRQSDIWLLRGGRVDAPRLVATRTVIAFAKYDLSSLKSRLQVLDAESGHLAWEEPEQLSLHSLIERNNHLYIGVNWEIRSYQLPEGKLLWRTLGKPTQRTGYELSWLDGNVINYSTTLEKDHSLLMSVYNSTTGNLLRQEKIPAQPWPLLITAQTEYQGECGKLLAVDRRSGKVEWQIELSGGCPKRWPTLVGTNLLVYTFADYRGSATNRIAGLYLIDAINGNIKWRALEGEIISNPAVIDRTVYAIRHNGDIVGLDLDMGQEIGTIQFNTNQTDPSQNAYWLATNGRQLFAYYGDSRELIAFQN